MSALERTTTVRDGRVISDYSSEGPTGNEEIIITRQSDPPLRAGTYFVSLGVRTTGVVAEGTVRAEFDTPLQTGDQIYYFPSSCRGTSWQTTITYINSLLSKLASDDTLLDWLSP